MMLANVSKKFNSPLTRAAPLRTFKISHEDIEVAHERIKERIYRTQVMTCRQVNEKIGKNVFFKCEHLQRTGSFKFRGATNTVMKLVAVNPKCPGVVTHSSGNHGQALALACKENGIPCTVVVPDNTAKVKTEAILRNGAELVLCKPTHVSRIEACEKVANETGKLYISSCDHEDVIAGQGTIAIEFLQDVPSLDAILVPISGGGMASGIAIAAKVIKPSIRVYLVTVPGKMLEECLRARKRLWPNPPQLLPTIAEGIRLQHLGFTPFEILCELAEKDVIEVTDSEIIDGMKLSFSAMKQVIEGAAGAGVAALFKQNFPEDVRNIGIILCGGNIDITHLPW